MKRFFSFVMFCILLGVVGLGVYMLASKGKDIVSQADSQDGSTSLLLAQAKQKTISEQAIVNDSKENYIGESVEECTIPEVEEFKTLGIISEEEEHYDDYYVWTQETLDELAVNVTLTEGEYYIVNYHTNEVITTKGVKIGENIYYKLSDIKEAIN